MRQHRDDPDCREGDAETLVDVFGQPRQDHIESPVIAEVCNDNRPDSLVAKEHAKGWRFLDGAGGRCVVLNVLQFLTADGRVLLG